MTEAGQAAIDRAETDGTWDPKGSSAASSEVVSAGDGPGA
jgi:hypothetical protein